MAWIDSFLAPRRSRLDIRRDDAGNYLIRRKDRKRGARAILVTAHLDHPAFVVVNDRPVASARGIIDLEFRGGVHNPYFVGSRIEVIDCAGVRHDASITHLDAAAKPFKRVRARLARTSSAHAIAAGDIGRWKLPSPMIVERDLAAPGEPERVVKVLETHACDDLAAVAAACAAFDRLLRDPKAANFGLLFTVAEEVGFIGAIHAARGSLIPASSRLLCLENSRSFPHDSPIGAGAILRVGDRLSVFTPALTNALSDLLSRHAKANPVFRWQRKLMPGGACEATAFAAYGFDSTCLCLPLGNYHNMKDIDLTVAAAQRNPKARGRVGCEFIAIDDFHSLVEMISIGVRGLAAADATRARRGRANQGHRPLMESIYRKGQAVLAG